MNLLPMNQLGAREIAPGTIQFGVLLPWVSAQDGNQLYVKIIHEKDQFIQAIQPRSVQMSHSVDQVYGDFWSCKVDIHPQAKPDGSSWGDQGGYVYRYELHNPKAGVLDWIVDPFAREFGIGKLSAFTLGYKDHDWSAHEAAWKTPALNDLVLYELKLDEFGGGLNGTIDRLDYLRDLGVNCLEIMPVSNVTLTVDWGFLPTGYFGVDERFGNRSDLQRLIDAAHQRGMAVILDVVYGHTSDDFTYCDLYRRLQYDENPFLGLFGEKNDYGKSTDFKSKLTQDFFYTVNYLWLDRFHVDGFRYDCVANYWDGPQGQGYANLVYSTYQYVKSKINQGTYWDRFSNNGINLIQCAERVDDPVKVLNESYSNCAWQDGTFNAAKAVARDVERGNYGAITGLGLSLGLYNYPEAGSSNNDTLHKTALQYIENHDHERFLCNFGLENKDVCLLQQGNRDAWPKVQPYLIGLLMAKGIPMLWQGESFGENYWIPSDTGPERIGRIMVHRPVRWDYFYDEAGKGIIGLVRKLLRLRQQRDELRNGNYYFYNEWDRYQSRGLLLFSRATIGKFTLVALNFGQQDQTVSFWFPISGTFVEKLHDLPGDRRPNVAANTETQLTIPGNYGRVWSN